MLLTDGMFYYDEPAINWTSCERDQYWPETAMAQISSEAEKELLEATFELHNMCLEIVEEIINDDNMLKLFHINEVLWPAVRKSWKEGH